LDQVFRKYSHSLGPNALEVLEDICDQHGFADDEIEHIMETLATEYNKQDGA
jgi:DNA polymerase epsilon subunit 2